MVRTLCVALVAVMAIPGWAGANGARALGTVAAPVAVPLKSLLPPSPFPIAPGDGDTVFTVAPTLEVESGVPFGWYHFRVMEGSSIAAEGFSPLPAWNVIAGGRTLQRGHAYRWTCRVRDTNGWSPWFGPHLVFRVDYNLSPPKPKLPQDRARVGTRRPVLVVAPRSGYARYRFRVWSGRTLLAEAVGSMPFWIYDGPALEAGNAYEWSCRVEYDEDTTGWFDPVWSFEIRDTPADNGVAGRGVDVRVQVVWPNPFRERVTFEFASAPGPDLRFEVFAADGRLVYSEAPGLRPAGESRLDWNGRDRRGDRVAPGTYLCRIRTQSGEQVFRLTKIAR